MIRSAVSHTAPGCWLARNRSSSSSASSATKRRASSRSATRFSVRKNPLSAAGTRVGRVDVAVQHAAAQLVGRGVDELELVGLAHHPVRHPLADGDARDPLDRIGQGLDVLDVDGRDHGDPGVEDLEHVLPALLVGTGTGHVGVRQLVDEDHLGPAVEHRREVHLGELGAAVLDRLSRHHRQVPDELGRVGPPVGLDQADHDVGPPLVAAPALVQHGAGLPDAGGRAEVEAELTGGPDVDGVVGDAGAAVVARERDHGRPPCGVTDLP